MDALKLPPKLPVAVEKPTPYTFDLGLLLATDPNPLLSTSEDALASTARDAAQALINQLLTTCPITAPSDTDGPAITLPPAWTPLPREKPLPPPKQMTKWERFAKKKGIAPKTREQRRNMVYDEEAGAWRPKWGMGGMNKKGEDDWLVEVDVNKEREGKEADRRKVSRQERKERVKKNEKQMRKNMLRALGKK